MPRYSLNQRTRFLFMILTDFYERTPLGKFEPFFLLSLWEKKFTVLLCTDPRLSVIFPMYKT